MDERAERLARGDPAAFEKLYDSCADRVHHYLVARLGSRSDADDVFQETFVRVARTRTRLASVDNRIAYVFTIARNEVTRLLQRHAREGRRVVTPLAESLFQEASSDGHWERETAEWVAASLARLTHELREIVELKIYADLTFREISAVTGLPQGTVATRYRSALEKLRGQLTKECE
ncbi:MAG: RNA polymerase sigma factor [Isosphaeraceae bacterium]